MAETRSKTSKKLGGSSSFISNLSSAIKKSSKRQRENNRVLLPNKKRKYAEVPAKIISDDSYGVATQFNSLQNFAGSSNSSETINREFEDFSEEPLCFDGSNKEAETCDDVNLVKNVTAKESNDSEANLQQVEDIFHSMSQGFNPTTISKYQEVIKGNEKEVEISSDSVNGSSACNTSHFDSSKIDFNVKGSCSETLLKPYNDLVNVLEEVKHINVVVKKMKEEMEKLIK